MRHFRPASIPADLAERAASIDIADLTIERAHAGLREGRFKPSELTAACLLQIARLEPYLHAYLWLNPEALDDALAVDTQVQASGLRGPLHGVPIVLKDNMNIAGVRTTAGYAGFASDDRIVDPQHGTFNGIDLMPERDASVVARLKAAGAIVLGKSNLPDFGLDGLRADSSHHGDTLNPYDARLAPGASSSGTATAVAVGMGIAGLGTDTAGSILFPASAQSLVGLKPSFGLVPIDGVYPGLSSHHDVVGPICRTVHDAAAMLDVIAGSTTADPRTAAIPPLADGDAGYVAALRPGALAGKRIGLFEPGIWAAPLHADVQAHYDQVVRRLEALGATPVPVVFGDTDWADRWAARKAFPQLNGYLSSVDAFLSALGGENPASRAAFAARAGFELGTGTTAPLHALLANPQINVPADDPALLAVIAEATALRERYEAILAAKRIDALMVPRSVNPLPDLDGDTSRYLGDQVVGTEVNEMGLPAITMPAGYLPDGRPIAIDIVGPARFTEREILALAFDFEQRIGERRPPAIAAR